MKKSKTKIEAEDLKAIEEVSDSEKEFDPTSQELEDEKKAFEDSKEESEAPAPKEEEAKAPFGTPRFNKLNRK